MQLGRCDTKVTTMRRFGMRSRGFSRSLFIACCGVILAYASALPTAVLAACGDGVVESPVEDCDDGNTEAGDCCAADCTFEPEDLPCGLSDLCLRAGTATCNGQGECTLGNSMFCNGGAKADLSDPGEPEAQRLKMRGKSAQASDNIGDPSVGTQYALCVYNFHSTGPLTVDYQLSLPVGEGWEPIPDGFTYKRPKGATTSLLRARISSRMKTSPFSGPYYAIGVKILGRGSALALPGPINSSRYFDVDQGISSVCVVNDLGFMVGVSTWGIAKNRSFVNDPDHVYWAPPRLGD